MPGRVFISHSSNDREVVETVLQALEDRGIRCWCAPRDIPAGMNYMGVIYRAIQNASLFLVVLSANANRSTDMKREASLATKHAVPTIPFRIDVAELDNDWAYAASVSQYVDASDGVRRAIPRLVEQVRGALAERQAGASLPPGEPPKVRPETRHLPTPTPAVSRKLVAVVALSICLAVGIALVSIGQSGSSPVASNARPAISAPAPSRTAVPAGPVSSSAAAPAALPAAPVGSPAPAHAPEYRGYISPRDPNIRGGIELKDVQQSTPSPR